MAKVRVRPETGTLYLDFFYRGVRCREQTALEDTAANRRQVEALMRRIEREIKHGLFDYAATFPDSPRALRFAMDASHEPGKAESSALPPEANPLPSFSDFAELWYSEKQPEWRVSHQRGVREILDSYLLPRFGESKVDAVTRPDVLAFRAELVNHKGRRGKLGPARVNKILCFCRQILNEAADRFEFSPAFRGVKSLKQKRTEVDPFSLEEVELIRTTIRADYRDYVTVRFYTGMRSGEINGLRWRNVDLDSGLILVRETQSGGELQDWAKNAGSIRDIPIMPQVREALVRLRDGSNSDEDYVFTSPRGGPIDGHNFANRVWYPLLRYLGLKRRRPYQTRHTAATLMLAAGENPEWIARVMGHTTTQMLFTVYSRYVPNLTRQDGRAFAGVLNGARTPDVQSNSELLDQLSDAEVRQMLAKLLAEKK